MPGFRERQGGAHESPKPLAQRVVEAFDVVGFARFFPDAFVLISRQDGIICRPEVMKTVRLAIGRRQGFRQTQTRADGTLAERKGDDLTGAAAERQPQPGLAHLVAHK